MLTLDWIILLKQCLLIVIVTVARTQKKKHYVSRVNRDQEGSSSEAAISKDQQQNACRSQALQCKFCYRRHALKHMKEESSIINRTWLLRSGWHLRLQMLDSVNNKSVKMYECYEGFESNGSDAVLQLGAYTLQVPNRGKSKKKALPLNKEVYQQNVST
ncbi:hypothetical protein Tco_0105471, partial [Tanacetum coccineum]